MAKPTLTQADVRRLFEYDAERGVLIWREQAASDFIEGPRRSPIGTAKLWNKKFAGKVAGNVRPDGYRHVWFGGRQFKIHRLIWLYVHGEWPKEVDHIFGKENGDRVEDLRSVEHVENTKNMALSKRNKSGTTGVSWKAGKWYAQIRGMGKTLSLGYFVEKSDAILARKSAEQRLGFHENHGRKAG